MDHAPYDRRRYPIVDVRAGYREWACTYEQTVHDEMDLRLLERLRTVDWTGCALVLDLACGTGRIGGWLCARSRGAAIDGLDITPEMLDRALLEMDEGLTVASTCTTTWGIAASTGTTSWPRRCCRASCRPRWRPTGRCSRRTLRVSGVAGSAERRPGSIQGKAAFLTDRTRPGSIGPAACDPTRVMSGSARQEAG